MAATAAFGSLFLADPTISRYYTSTSGKIPSSCDASAGYSVHLLLLQFIHACTLLLTLIQEYSSSYGCIK